jgi:elongation factor G
MVVDAVHGVEVQTEKLWAEAAALNLPRLVVVDRLDRERASLERSLDSLHHACAREIVPVQLPIGEEKQFTGVVDLVAMKALTFAANDSGTMTEGEIPAALADRAAAARDALIEMVAEADEQLMETFFNEGTLTQAQLVEGLRTATMPASCFPSSARPACTRSAPSQSSTPSSTTCRRPRSATFRPWPPTAA